MEQMERNGEKKWEEMEKDGKNQIDKKGEIGKMKKTEKHREKKKQPKVAKSNQGVFEQQILNLPNLPRETSEIDRTEKNP